MVALERDEPRVRSRGRWHRINQRCATMRDRVWTAKTRSGGRGIHSNRRARTPRRAPKSEFLALTDGLPPGSRIGSSHSLTVRIEARGARRSSCSLSTSLPRNSRTSPNVRSATKATRFFPLTHCRPCIPRPPAKARSLALSRPLVSVSFLSAVFAIRCGTRTRKTLSFC